MDALLGGWELPPEYHRKSRNAGGAAHHRELSEPRHGADTHRPQPSVRECRPQQRAEHSFEQVDLGVHKQLRLWSESSKLDFRTEAFNLTNQTNFQAANSSISSGSFGAITSTFPARQIQFALKLLF